MDELRLERVLAAVELIPPGRVASYGNIGAVTGNSARLVGRILREYGSTVPWWRVTNAAGDHPVRPSERWMEHWAAEGIRLKPNRQGCRIGDHRADLAALAEAYAAHMRALGEEP
ncbi:alkylated DNA nucleotide flippase Atl1 [Naumannella cuiyingiana]|uniref:Alkylated DNA nucleotide flippase Atl1 n=1 Tax=Naumannella cuiyingiana TaxID=1347891 RepID=A0A7Z0D691_9ACTN|nr:MGMT family protein [Naumannella cuiyingiana]NYI69657.1 alkylated DNA nucleotide flippase Atl1 [Naumannella cuiyingiana]